MNQEISVSTPSRLCLFGEHQDYLGLEVIAAAIDLRFFARIKPRSDRRIHIAIRDSRLDRLDSVNDQGLYEHVEVDLEQPVVYQSERDYLRSVLQVLRRSGYELQGFDIKLDSEIPIGKGMCSSSTMIVVLIKAILEAIGHPDKDRPAQIAELAFLAEVAEFNEPGGKMDHYTSALGGLVHLNFSENMTIRNLPATLNGRFILFDSLEQKDTTRVLAESKIPAQEALRILRPAGVNGVRDFISDPEKMPLLDQLDSFHRQKLAANIENYRLLQQGAAELAQSPVDDRKLGHLIDLHHQQLRDGLNISTARIEEILACARDHGAYGGKVNGSGGGGCCFVYAAADLAPHIVEAVAKKGYPGRILRQDTGVRRDN